MRGSSLIVIVAFMLAGCVGNGEFAGLAKGVSKMTAAGKEVWQCFAPSDYRKRKALFVLVRANSRAVAEMVRNAAPDDGDLSVMLGRSRLRSMLWNLDMDMGVVLVAGTTHFSTFKIAGLNRRWDWDLGAYAFIVEPDGTGLYIDFSTSSDGKAKASDVFKCKMASTQGL